MAANRTGSMRCETHVQFFLKVVLQDSLKRAKALLERPAIWFNSYHRAQGAASEAGKKLASSGTFVSDHELYSRRCHLARRLERRLEGASAGSSQMYPFT